MSHPLQSFWTSLSHSGRIVCAGVAVLVISALIWTCIYTFRQEYGLLFSDLAQEDAAKIVQQLKKRKILYRLGNDGTSITVPVEQVHDIRLSLMSSDLPLSGGVGFEIFDKQSLGMSEHAQKVSYQRALQGELARTIMSLDNVKQARVHLVLPDATLFTRDRREASAAVTVAMRPGAALQPQQIAGVQRLVAAAVSGLESARVVVSDQRGVTLSSTDPAGGTGAAEAKLQVKREIEEYMTHKVAHLLDSAFGAGQAIVSVDATLSFDTSKTTIQDLLPATSDPRGIEGRIVRRRQVTGASGTQLPWTNTADAAAKVPTPGGSMEIEYEYGRRIAEVVAAPGAVTRMSIGVIVPGIVSEEKRQKITELVRMAAGIDEQRGDAVSVQALDQVHDPELPASLAVEAEAQPESAAVKHGVETLISKQQLMTAVALPIALLCAAPLLLLRMRRAKPLSIERRQQLLTEIRQRLVDENAAAGT